jgi:hypothetical protein
MNARMSCLRILLIDIVIGAVVGCSALYGSSQPSTNAVMRAVPLATWSESGQRPEPAIRIVDSIEERRLVTLKGSTHPLARAANDRGRVSPELPVGDASAPSAYNWTYCGCYRTGSS